MQNLKNRLLLIVNIAMENWMFSHRWRSPEFHAGGYLRSLSRSLLLPSFSFSLSLHLHRRDSILHHHVPRKSVTLGSWMKMSWAESVFGAFFQLYILHDSKFIRTGATKHWAASTVPGTVANKSRSSWGRDCLLHIRSECKLLHTHRPRLPRKRLHMNLDSRGLLKMAQLYSASSLMCTPVRTQIGLSSGFSSWYLPPCPVSSSQSASLATRGLLSPQRPTTTPQFPPTLCLEDGIIYTHHWKYRCSNFKRMSDRYIGEMHGYQ